MSNPRLSKIAATMAELTAPSGMTTKLIGIDGCGGAGKSTLASRLASILDASIIHTDDFATGNNAQEWHHRLFGQVIAPFMRNAPAHYQRCDWATRKLAEWHTVPAGGLVFIEGVSATCGAFRHALTYCIYVDAPRDVRLARGLRRDGDDATTLWQQWQAEEDAYLAAENPAKYADLVVDGTMPFG